jgi:hypothetical protein
MALESSGQNFEKSASIKIQENLSTRSRVILRGQRDKRTDRHDEANCCFPQFFELSFYCSIYLTEDTLLQYLPHRGHFTAVSTSQRTLYCSIYLTEDTLLQYLPHRGHFTAVSASQRTLYCSIYLTEDTLLQYLPHRGHFIDKSVNAA